MNPLLLLLAVGALPQRLELAFTQEPGGCALDVRLPQSIARYVPRLSRATEPGEGTWRLVVASRPGEVEIRLADDHGEEQLSRVLRAEQEACAATADGIGLILERYLSDLGYETGFEPLPEIELPAVPTATTATTATIASQVDTPPSTSPVDTTPLGMEIDARLTFEVPNEAGFRVGGGIDLALELSFLRFELGLFGLAPARVDVERGGTKLGEYSVWALGAVGRVGACTDVSVFSICGLLGGGVERVQGSVEGDLVFQQAPRNEVGGILSFGVRTAWEIGLFRVYFRGETVVRPDRAKFEVTGAQPVYRDSRVAAFLSIGVGVQVF